MFHDVTPVVNGGNSGKRSRWRRPSFSSCYVAIPQIPSHLDSILSRLSLEKIGFVAAKAIMNSPGLRASRMSNQAERSGKAVLWAQADDEGKWGILETVLVRFGVGGQRIVDIEVRPRCGRCLPP